MKEIKIVEFESKYKKEAKEIAHLAMEDAGIDSDTLNEYIDDDFNYETIPEVYRGRSRLWVALVEDKVIGTIAIEEIDTITARLRRMFVLPKLHRMGVGQKLFNIAFLFAKERRYQKIVLDTDKLMHKAHIFYQKNGFHITRTEGDRIFYEKSI